MNNNSKEQVPQLPHQEEAQDDVSKVEMDVPSIVLTYIKNKYGDNLNGKGNNNSIIADNILIIISLDNKRKILEGIINIFKPKDVPLKEFLEERKGQKLEAIAQQFLPGLEIIQYKTLAYRRGIGIIERMKPDVIIFDGLLESEHNVDWPLPFNVDRFYLNTEINEISKIDLLRLSQGVTLNEIYEAERIIRRNDERRRR